MEDNKELVPTGISLSIETPHLGSYHFECRDEDNVEAVGTALENIGNVNHLRILQDENVDIKDRVWVTIPRKVLDESVIFYTFIFDEEEEA